MSLLGGYLKDIPKDTPRKYPAAGKRPVRLSINTWVGIVGYAQHYTIRLVEENNPFICNCDRHEGVTEHSVWDDTPSPKSRTIGRVTNYMILRRAVQRLQRMYEKSPTHCLEIESFTAEDIKEALEAMRPSKRLTGD